LKPVFSPSCGYDESEAARYFVWLTRKHHRPVVQLSDAAGRIADGPLDCERDKSIRWRRDGNWHVVSVGAFDHRAGRMSHLFRQQRIVGKIVLTELRLPLARLCVAWVCCGMRPRKKKGLGIFGSIEPRSEPEHLDQTKLDQPSRWLRIDSGAERGHKGNHGRSAPCCRSGVAGRWKFECPSTVMPRSDHSGLLPHTGVARAPSSSIEKVVRNAIGTPANMMWKSPFARLEADACF